MKMHIGQRVRFGGWAGALLAFGLVCGMAQTAAAQEQVIKFATLAPEGSSWMKLIHSWASSIEKRAPGVKIKFFAGGVAGDERDAVRKMKLGQIQGAAVTGIGLGLLQPEVRVFELPFVFKDDAQMIKIRASLEPEIRKLFEDKGYVLLNWGDVGPVHVFSNIPITSKDDLRKTKLWEWSDDPLIKALFAELGLKGVALGVPDVLPSLQTGLIDACYGSALSTIALQWQTKVKFMTKMDIGQSIGAQVITKAAWDKLGPTVQQVFKEESKILNDKLQLQVQSDNAKALEKMKSQGLTVVDTSDALITEFKARSKAVAAKLDGQVYSNAFRTRVEKLASQ